MEFNGFEEGKAQEFFNHTLHDVGWENGQSLSLSHLNEKGVSSLNKHVLNKEDSE